LINSEFGIDKDNISDNGIDSSDGSDNDNDKDIISDNDMDSSDGSDNDNDNGRDANGARWLSSQTADHTTNTSRIILKIPRILMHTATATINRDCGNDKDNISDNDIDSSDDSDNGNDKDNISDHGMDSSDGSGNDNGRDATGARWLSSQTAAHTAITTRLPIQR